MEYSNLQADDKSPEFKTQSTFIIRPPFDKSKPANCFSLERESKPSFYLREQDNSIYN
jgi:hypothetical protein